MASNIDDDEYVASLLEQDAKTARKKYELVGIDAFNPKRLRSGAPKPNTNFLRHIIRQTDSHNSALLAKEAEESHARLRRMDRERHRANREDKHRWQSSVYDDEEDEDENAYNSRRRKRQRDGSLESRSRRHRDSSRHTRREKRTRHENSGEDDNARSARRSRHDRERRRHGSEEVDGRSRRRETTDHRRKRHKSTSRSRSRSPRSSRHYRRGRHRDRSRSPRSRSRSGNRVSSRPIATSQKDRIRSASPMSDSDPLETIVGPLPPPAEPIVRSRGRGAHKTNSMGIDSRFSATYDPSVDVRQASNDEDDWGDAVEAFRDRQRWKQQGAERLKAAGFTDDQVKKWSKGEEKSEEDVVWTRTGQAREWDRGKVLDEDGHVDLKAEWGRLK